MEKICRLEKDKLKWNVSSTMVSFDRRRPCTRSFRSAAWICSTMTRVGGGRGMDCAAGSSREKSCYTVYSFGHFAQIYLLPINGGYGIFVLKTNGLLDFISSQILTTSRNIFISYVPPIWNQIQFMDIPGQDSRPHRRLCHVFSDGLSDGPFSWSLRIWV